MVLCPKCNRSFDDDFDFCPFCGCEKPYPKVCSRCSFETYDEFSFCPKCGSELMSEDVYLNAINNIASFIENEDYGGAIIKCEEQFDEKNYHGLRIKEAVLQVYDEEMEKETRTKENIKTIRKYRSKIRANEKEIEKYSKMEEEVSKRCDEVNKEIKDIDMIRPEYRLNYQIQNRAKLLREKSSLIRKLGQLEQINNNYKKANNELIDIIKELEKTDDKPLSDKFKKIVGCGDKNKNN